MTMTSTQIIDYTSTSIRTYYRMNCLIFKCEKYFKYVDGFTIIRNCVVNMKVIITLTWILTEMRSTDSLN